MAFTFVFSFPAGRPITRQVTDAGVMSGDPFPPGVDIAKIGSLLALVSELAQLVTDENWVAFDLQLGEAFVVRETVALGSVVTFTVDGAGRLVGSSPVAGQKLALMGRHIELVLRSIRLLGDYPLRGVTVTKS